MRWWRRSTKHYYKETMFFQLKELSSSLCFWCWLFFVVVVTSTDKKDLKTPSPFTKPLRIVFWCFCFGWSHIRIVGFFVSVKVDLKKRFGTWWLIFLGFIVSNGLIRFKYRYCGTFFGSKSCCMYLQNRHRILGILG